MNKQIAITKINNKNVLAYIEDNTIYDILMEDSDENVGDIYIAKVKNIIKNINAAFVQISNEKLAYLSLKRNNLKNIHNEDEILVQVKKAAIKTKQAVVSDNIEFVGKYVVLSLLDREKKISSKIHDSKVIDELSILLNDLKEIPYGLILRTNTQKSDIEEIKKEAYLLSKKMDEMLNKSKYSKALSKIYRLIRK